MPANLTTHGKNMSFRLIPKLLESLEIEVAKVNNAGATFLDKRVSKEAAVNAILAVVLGMEIKDRRALIMKGLQTAETILSLEHTDG
jgi:hypothetical protein